MSSRRTVVCNSTGLISYLKLKNEWLSYHGLELCSPQSSSDGTYSAVIVQHEETFSVSVLTKTESTHTVLYVQSTVLCLVQYGAIELTT